MVTHLATCVGFVYLLVAIASSVAIPERCYAQDTPLTHFEERIRPLFIRQCIDCHNDKVPEGGLSLESAAGWSSRQVVKPGSPETSLLMTAVKHEDKDLVMPPLDSGKKLSQRDIDDLEQWIRSGAIDPRKPMSNSNDRESNPDKKASGPQRRSRVFEITPRDRDHWAFQPLRREIVQSRNEVVAQSQHPIDHRIDLHLTKLGLHRNERASPRELVRRAFFDLWGLPPKPEDVEEFERNPTELAWEQLVDRLLASHHYGERSGRHWLDLVRYAETNGYERDGPKPNAWKYRDYVIRSFQQDKPYDLFLAEQLAGDLLLQSDSFDEEPESDRWRDAIIATGYYRMHVWDDEPDDTEAAELDELDDVIVTTSVAVLGMTIGCARCHDHKFDPISQSDYYSFLDLFRDIDPYGQSKKGGGSRPTGKINRYLVSENKMREWEESKSKQADRIVNKLAQAETEARASLEAELKSLKMKQPPFEFALAVQPPLVRKTTSVLHRGDYQSPRHVVEAGVPQIFNDLTMTRGDLSSDVYRENEAESESGASTSGNSAIGSHHGEVKTRLDLAKWFAHPSNPLTARVLANRVWQKHFGAGIVPTPDDFGMTGIAPRNVELLDWLASELIQSGWSIKSLHRSIMLSEAYRMSSSNPPVSADHADPVNELFWRQNLRRLDAEAIRDSMLVYSDSLNEKRDGPSIYASLSDEIRTTANPVSIDKWVASPERDQNCRSVFLVVKRSMKDPLLESFDFVNSHSPVGNRSVTTTAPQALMLLHDQFVTRQAERMVSRMEHFESDLEKIQWLWRVVYQRNPKPIEIEHSLKFLSQSESSWVGLCRALLNSTESIYVD